MAAWSSVKASGRNVWSYGAGIVTGISAVTVLHMLDAATVDRLLDGLNQIAVAIGGLAGVLNVAYNAFSAWRRASPEEQQASVAARPDRMVAEIDPAHSIDAAVGATFLPGVKRVITSQSVADAIPSDKVVGPSTEVTK